MRSLGKRSMMVRVIGVRSRITQTMSNGCRRSSYDKSHRGHRQGNGPCGAIAQSHYFVRGLDDANNLRSEGRGTRRRFSKNVKTFHLSF